MTLEEKVYHYLDKTIYEWVKQCFGGSEANDPSWNIEALAHDLAHRMCNDNIRFDIFREIERGYLKDDCDMVAEGMEVELTDKEREAVVDEFMDSDAYIDAHAEDWQWFIKQELKHREEM